MFRTFKGDIVTGVRGIIILKNTDPRNPIQCEPIGFESEEYALQQLRDPPQTAHGERGRIVTARDRSVRRSGP